MLGMQDITELIENVRNTFGIDANTFATITITISIFIIGYVLNFLATGIKNSMERKNTTRIFKIALEKHIHDIQKQEEACSKTLSSLSFENRTNFKFVYQVMASKDLFWNFGFQKTYEAYFNGYVNWFRFGNHKTLTAFNNVWNAIESTAYWHNQYASRSNEFLTNYNSSNSKRNDAVDGYRKYFQQINTLLEGQIIPERLGDYLRELWDIHVSWSKLPDRTSPPICHRHLVLRNRILYKKYSDLDLAFKINDFFLDASTHYLDQSNRIKFERLQTEVYRKLFKYNAKLLAVCILRLNESRWKVYIRFGISLKNKLFRKYEQSQNSINKRFRKLL